ncbi:MAG: biotin--[acetyl-CoA-carboxylase] ligase [Chthonomonas sp.]|nr:biotin--[acetyl-CoA-carboxylase] ligase [Chthonomonas sp.]
MKSPLSGATWQAVEATASTQRDLAALVQKGEFVGALWAKHQTEGKGRFGREWYSEAGNSLTISLAFHEYADHPKPWLIGMAVGLAAASACHCKIAWPNDLVLQGKKVGGILTELVTNPDGRLIPVVGVGINFAVAEFPDGLTESAANVHQGAVSADDVEQLAKDLIDRIEGLPEPDAWSSLRPVWSLFDATPQKQYRLANGGDAIGMGIGPEGELICSVEGETQTVLAADAIFGPASS